MKQNSCHFWPHCLKIYCVCQGLFVAFIIKNNDMIILFACLIGWLDSSQIKKIKAQSLKKLLGFMLGLLP